MWTLMDLEERHEGFGQALVPEFFPGKLRKWEEDWWSSSDPDERRRLLGQQHQEEWAKQRRREQAADKGASSAV